MFKKFAALILSFLAFGSVAVAAEAYLESDGTQLLPVDFYPTGVERVEVDCQLTEVAARATICGCYGGAGAGVLLQANGNQNFEAAFNWYRSTGGCAAADTARHLLVVDATAHTLRNYAADGSLIKEATASQTTGYQVGVSDRALVFFGNNGAVKADYEGTVPAKMKLYAAKVYRGDVLTHDYVPAVKNGVAGLYDRESEAFFAPSEGALASGGDLYEVPAEDAYVESTGDQLVALDYITNPKTQLTVDYQIVSRKANAIILGAKIEYSVGFGLQENAHGNLEGHLNGAWTGGWSGQATTDRRTVVMDVPGTNIVLRSAAGETLATHHAWNGSNAGATNDSKLSLFGDQSKEKATRSAARIYRVCVREDGQVVRFYKPCIKDGVIGFKDAKTGNFFPGLDTGLESRLVCGGAVPCEGVPEAAYVESDGTQFVSTGYKVKPSTVLKIDFACLSTNNDVVIAGSWGLDDHGKIGKHGVGFYRNGSGNMEFVDDWKFLSTGTPVGLQRNHAEMTIGRDGENRYEASFGTVKTSDNSEAYVTEEAPVAIGLFGNARIDGGYQQLSAVRIYSFTILEGTTVVHQFVPYTDGTRVGFKDLITRKVIVNSAAGAHPLKVGGEGVLEPTKGFILIYK